MYKILNSFAAKIIFLILLFQVTNLSIFSQKESDWTAPFKQCWAYKSNQVVADKVASDNASGLILVPTFSGILTAIDIKTGSVLWNTDIGGELVYKPVFNDGSLYLLVRKKSQDISDNPVDLRSVDIKTGLTKKEKTLYIDQVFSLNSNAPALLTQSGGLSIIGKGEEVEDLSVSQSTLAPLQISMVKVFDNTLLIGTVDKKIIMISVSGGELLKKLDVNDAASDVFWDGKTKLFWADARGLLNAFDTVRDEFIWKRRTGAALSGITSTTKGFLVVSLDNFVYLIDKKDGDVIWKKRFDSKLLAYPSVKGDLVVVVPFESNTATIVRISDGKILNTIRLSDAQFFLSNPVVSDDGLIFSTSEGVFLYSVSGC